MALMEEDEEVSLLPFPKEIFLVLNGLQILIGAILVILHLVYALTEVTWIFALGGIPGLVFITAGVIGVVCSPREKLTKCSHRLLAAFCIFAWLWALVFPFIYYFAYLYFFGQYEESNYDYPILELVVGFYVLALLEGFVSIAVFSYSCAALSDPRPSKFQVIAQL